MSVFIVSGCRTAIGNLQGQFEKYSASELGAIAISEAIKRANLSPEDIQQVIMGHVLTAGQGQNPARQAAVGAKIPYNSPAYCINMLCGSGLKAVTLAYQGIRNGDFEIALAGGQESMTRAQHSAYIRGNKMGGLQLVDTMVFDGLTDAFHNCLMGCTAEHVAKEHNVSRETQDKLALGSQEKAQRAIREGFFIKEIVPVPDKRSGKLIAEDEFPKESTLEGLSGMRPAFDKNGTVTAGNASGINDGAAALVICSENQVKSRQLTPLARIIGFAEAGVDPMSMGLGPIGAITRLLQKIGWSKDEVDLYEINEAFASLSVVVLDTLKLDADKVNVSGGAIALGHPIGASGARVLVTLIHNLERLQKKRGVASLCIGGGMGIALAVELC